MADILENIGKTLKNGTGKKYGLSGGTVFFLLFNVTLIIGFCKFSFYVLKNHRSAIDRDSLVKTYVDVQPYRANKKIASGYVSLNTLNKEAPAPFFVKDETTISEARISNSEKEIIPLPALQKTEEKNEFKLAAKAMGRPPVIRSKSENTLKNQPEAVEVPVTPEFSGADLETIPLEGLMEAGISLLDESDTVLASSELLLQEEDVLALNDTVHSQEKSDLPIASETKTVSVSKEKSASLTAIAPKAKKTIDKNGTHWVDVAELRHQLSLSVANGISEKEKIARQNTALLEMNGAKQVAALNVKTDSDVAENKDSDKKAENSLNISKKNEDISIAGNQTAVVQDAPFAGTSDAGEKQLAVVQDVPFAGTSDAGEKQLAVVQDIPFAGTSETEKPLNKQTLPTIKNRTNLAGDSPSLWKIAKVKGKPKNSLAVKQEENKSVQELAKKDEIKKETLKTDKFDVIYRNGRAVELAQNQEKKSLNWLDRQEAAVWTSMSQSDAPSVWSSAAEKEALSSDRAKAFRVADEQPAPTTESRESNVVNSAPVRVIGEEVKPEAKANPLLLPLGNKTANKAEPVNASPQIPSFVPSASPAVVPNVNPNGFHAALPEETQTKKNSQGSNEGLMTKLFSFLGKDTATDELPNIGSGTPLKSDGDKKEEKTEKTKRQAAKETKKKETSFTSDQVADGNKQIIPTELRLTFKPNSTEMSSQSIKWVKAFGQRAKKDIQNAVEVRMSNKEPALQEKRFLMIRNTLLGSGMEDVQILPVMTDRTPHTIVLRTVVLPEEGYTEYTTESYGVKERRYYKQW